MRDIEIFINIVKKSDKFITNIEVVPNDTKSNGPSYGVILLKEIIDNFDPDQKPYIKSWLSFVYDDFTIPEFIRSLKLEYPQYDEEGKWDYSAEMVTIVSMLKRSVKLNELLND